jgi:hypothetical protein
MDEKEKSPGTTGIWDSANQARDIHLALMLALASTAFADGWEALRPRIAAAKQDEPGCEPEETADRKKGRRLLRGNGLLPVECVQKAGALKRQRLKTSTP